MLEMADYWIEERTAIRTGVPMSYGVWTIRNEARVKVADFSVSRKGGASEARRLADLACRDFIAGSTEKDNA